MPAHNKVPALPVEVVERVLPLVPACTLLRARAVCRCVRASSTQRPWRRGGCAVSGDPAADVSGGVTDGSGGEEVGFAAGVHPAALAGRVAVGALHGRASARGSCARAAQDVGNLRPPPRARAEGGSISVAVAGAGSAAGTRGIAGSRARLLTGLYGKGGMPLLWALWGL